MQKIVVLGNPILVEKSEVVNGINEDLNALIHAMFETMYRERGIGLAAVQIGRPLRIFVTHIRRDTSRVFINPEIAETSLEEDMLEEGCLSIPGINADVKRSTGVKVQAMDENGKLFMLNTEGLLARVVLHEMDHLNGVVFIDRLMQKKRQQLLNQYKRRMQS